jgi:hypothetical protein
VAPSLSSSSPFSRAFSLVLFAIPHVVRRSEFWESESSSSSLFLSFLFLFLVKGMVFFIWFIFPERFFKIESLVAAAMAVGKATGDY